MSDLWRDKTDAELLTALDEYAVAQERLAAAAKEDMTHWHHRSVAWLLAEAASRLRKAWSALQEETR